MAVSNSVIPWTLQMPAGSLQEYNFILTVPGQFTTTPWPISGFTWEYVARPTATDESTPLIEVTTTPSSAGLLTITSTADASATAVAVNSFGYNQ